MFISLVATIKKVRPDLLSNTYISERAQPILEEEPAPKTLHIEDIGEPTNPRFFTLSNIDPTNW